jgi:Secretion system C-terminal sorting domain
MTNQLKTTILFLLLCNVVKAQLITPQTINSAGNSSSNAVVLLESSLGGLLISTINTPTFMYTQDFLQPNAGTITVPPIINNVVLDGRGYGYDNAGTTFIAGNAMIEFTLGEPASITLSSANNMLTQGILQPYSTGIVLPVTGLEFYAKRINNTQVQLDWKTLQEINNKGFHIERKKETESSFANMGFEKSNASGGNSSSPLQYQKLDNNNFTGSTYYRLKQEDIDGRSTYSVIRIVKGDANKQLTMQVWPVPAVGFFNVSVNGLSKPDVIQVLDMNGRLVKQLAIQNQTQQQVNGLPAGTYFVKLGSDKSVGQKVIVQ